MPTEHTAVILMLCVTTPGDPITAFAKMDFLEMEQTALVTIYSTACFNASFAL